MPVLIRHVPVSAADHPRELTVGTIGTDGRWEAPYLVASVTVWDQAAIEAAVLLSRPNQMIASGLKIRPGPLLSRPITPSYWSKP
jgi:uncharacterized protein